MSSRYYRSSRHSSFSRDQSFASLTSSCAYDFEHDCEVANCQDNHHDIMVLNLEEESICDYLFRLSRLYLVAIVSVYSSIGLWVSIWNNFTLTGLGLFFCYTDDGSSCNQEDQKVSLQFLITIVGLMTQFLCASFLENGQVCSRNDPCFSRFEKLWDSLDYHSLWYLHVFRGLLAYVAQIMTTCGIYNVILLLYCLDEPSFRKDFSLLIFGLAGFASIIVYFEYFNVGLTIERLEQDGPSTALDAQDMFEDQFVVDDPLTQHFVHVPSVMQPIGLVVEPLEPPTDFNELEANMESLLSSNQPETHNIAMTRFQRLRQILRTRRRFLKYRYVALSLLSHTLQSCSWLGMDRLGQVWLASPDGIPLVDKMTAEVELCYMGIGLFLMITTGTFMVHSCMESSRNVACQPYSRLLSIDVTVGWGLVYSFVVEFLGLWGSYMNITGFWYLLDEHMGLPQTTWRNIALSVFLIPLTLSGTFYQEAGVTSPVTERSKSMVQTALESWRID